MEKYLRDKFILIKNNLQWAYISNKPLKSFQLVNN